MLKRITSIGKAFSNGYWPLPVAWGVLECGHTCVLARAVNFDCARGHDESSYTTKVGDAVECGRCNRHALALARLRAMRPGDVHLARLLTSDDGRGSGDGYYHVYEHDPRSPSPTGVRFLLSIEATEEALTALRALQVSPLSPTEPQ